MLLRNGSEASPFLSNKGEVLKRNELLGYHSVTGEGFFASKRYFDLTSTHTYLSIHLHRPKVLKLHILIMIFWIIDLVMLDATGMTSS